MESPILAALRRAVEAAPTDIALRLHLADQLLLAGDQGGAVAHAAIALQQDPQSAEARAVMARALAGGSGGAATAAGGAPADPGSADPAPTEPVTQAGAPAAGPGAQPPEGSDRPADSPADDVTFDWAAAESQLGDAVAPMFVDGPPDDQAASGGTRAHPAEAPAAIPDRFAVEHTGITLADVGGMTAVKDRLNAAFLAPLSNPKLRKLYAKRLRGGLLLYGPPGCGKTFIARALAGELRASFMNIGIADILDPYLGQSERNLHEAFQIARRAAPCVLFIDEVDALGARRSQQQSGHMRGAVNQLLTELDGISGINEGLFVLAATNQPWDVDPALRRPGRLDRTVLVLPPDRDARREIFRFHLLERPVEGIDLGRLADRSDGMSGADIAYVCEAATENALLEGVATNDVRPIRMPDFEAALAEIRPSIAPWLDSARNMVLFSDDDGTYAELRTYLKKRKRL